MPSYMQMGHDTENLVGEEELDFSGLVLSPVNRFPHELVKHISRFRQKGNYDLILDSQLYFPRSLREKLNKYPYFPNDIDTTDLSSTSWWEDLNRKLCEYCNVIGIDGVTSPAILPKIMDDSFYLKAVEVCNGLVKQIGSCKIKTYQTVLVEYSYLTKEENIFKTASILSDSECDCFYLVFLSDISPRSEIADSFEMLGAMRLIRELKSTGKKVFVAFCSSEMILYKCAGADFCSTGKFFNLRRFTKSRFEEPSEGGGQLPYWFEHGLMAFLRDADILRIQSKSLEGILEQASSKNCWSQKILQQFRESPSQAWLALGWRQYLSWFSNTELFLDMGESFQKVNDWLIDADQNWNKIDQNKIYFQERKNDGEWVRAWLQALNDFNAQ